MFCRLSELSPFLPICRVRSNSLSNLSLGNDSKRGRVWPLTDLKVACSTFTKIWHCTLLTIIWWAGWVSSPLPRRNGFTVRRVCRFATCPYLFGCWLWNWTRLKRFMRPLEMPTSRQQYVATLVVYKVVQLPQRPVVMIASGAVHDSILCPFTSYFQRVQI